MTLLTLRDFKLPPQIFLGERGKAQSISRNEAYE
jgi:hypothetical protein